jgi:hypothetical protein
MKDFEVHERGTAEELRLSRRLADVIGQEHDQWRTVSPTIMKAYNDLYNHYMKQLETEQDR